MKLFKNHVTSCFHRIGTFSKTQRYPLIGLGWCSVGGCRPAFLTTFEEGLRGTVGTANGPIDGEGAADGFRPVLVLLRWPRGARTPRGRPVVLTCCWRIFSDPKKVEAVVRVAQVGKSWWRLVAQEAAPVDLVERVLQVHGQRGTRRCCCGIEATV